MNSAEQALSVYKTTSTFSNLQKAELGIYGLASANGLSEYITGKDMFGNELTDVQRQSSLYNSILGASLVASPFVPSLVKNGKLVKEETLNQLHKLATKTKSGARYVYDEVRGGMQGLLGNQIMNFAYAGADGVKPILSNVMNSKEVSKRIEEVTSKFSFGKNMGGSKGTAKKSSLVGREVELEWLGDNYKAIEIEGTVKVGGKEMDISRRVYQKIDIDFDYTPKTKGLSNRELVAKGRPPYVIDKNGEEAQIELHHIIKKESGNMVEIIATTHDDYKKILHGLIKNGDSFRNDEVLDKQFNNFRKKYWKWRSNNLE
ncbi:HNH/ENDO VII family nuclease [Metabacillus niabensis]|uniref:HNH/ENDO VII family nuclease n=1 Tax=Metabacillus niabensis TaxID=324854 RepID=UPI00299E1BF2|nr:HNH/ENDO VII family nuclease [Metabacillus niabensis]